MVSHRNGENEQLFPVSIVRNKVSNISQLSIILAVAFQHQVEEVPFPLYSVKIVNYID